MKTAKKGDWVQIHQIVLRTEERTGRIPEDTRKTDLQLWVKGFIQTDGTLGDTVTVKTITGRIVEGSLLEVNPGYTFGFGEEFVPEVLQIGIQLREILKEGEN